MFLHTHPYAPFNLKNATKLIVGTLPPPRFTTGELLPDDVDFCYGSRNGMLWPILDKIYSLNLVYENSQHAINQRKNFLLDKKIGVCDIVASAERDKIDASDIGMQHVVLRDLIAYLKEYKQINTLLFTGGNSKNGPEYFFRRQAKSYKKPLTTVQKEVPRIYEFTVNERKVRTVSLTAPSGSANRAIGSMSTYKKHKAQNPDFNTLDFRILQYSPFF